MGKGRGCAESSQNDEVSLPRLNYEAMVCLPLGQVLKVPSSEEIQTVCDLP